MFVVGSLGCWQQIAHVISGVLKIDSAKFKRRLPGSEAKLTSRVPIESKIVNMTAHSEIKAQEHTFLRLSRKAYLSRFPRASSGDP